MGVGTAGVGGGWPLRVLGREAENGCYRSAHCWLLVVLAAVLDSSPRRVSPHLEQVFSLQLVPERCAQRRVFMGTLESCQVDRVSRFRRICLFVLWPEVLRITLYMSDEKSGGGRERVVT